MLNKAASFADMSLKVVAVRAADNSDFEFEFPPSGPQKTLSIPTTPLEEAILRSRDPVAQTEGWIHGGINE